MGKDQVKKKSARRDSSSPEKRRGRSRDKKSKKRPTKAGSSENDSVSPRVKKKREPSGKSMHRKKLDSKQRKRKKSCSDDDMKKVTTKKVKRAASNESCLHKVSKKKSKPLPSDSESDASKQKHESKKKASKKKMRDSDSDDIKPKKRTSKKNELSSSGCDSDVKSKKVRKNAQQNKDNKQKKSPKKKRNVESDSDSDVDKRRKSVSRKDAKSSKLKKIKTGVGSHGDNVFKSSKPRDEHFVDKLSSKRSKTNQKDNIYSEKKRRKSRKSSKSSNSSSEDCKNRNSKGEQKNERRKSKGSPKSKKSDRKRAGSEKKRRKSRKLSKSSNSSDEDYKNKNSKDDEETERKKSKGSPKTIKSDHKSVDPSPEKQAVKSSNRDSEKRSQSIDKLQDDAKIIDPKDSFKHNVEDNVLESSLCVPVQQSVSVSQVSVQQALLAAAQSVKERAVAIAENPTSSISKKDPSKKTKNDTKKKSGRSSSSGSSSSSSASSSKGGRARSWASDVSRKRSMSPPTRIDYAQVYYQAQSTLSQGQSFMPQGQSSMPQGIGTASMNASGMNLVPLQKNFYKEHPNVSARSTEEICAFLTKHEITIRGAGAPRPIQTFEEAGFPDYVLRAIMACGFPSPSAIQVGAWPIALSGRDMIGIARTGSGKTLGFLLPSIVHINAQPPLQYGDGFVVLVMAPTRELAVQIKGECDKFGHQSKVRNTCVYGGAPKHQQQADLNRGVHICIATPGRLIDFLESGVTNCARVTSLILDEADRMLDMGFEPQIRKIVAQIRPDRQTMLWSATWPREIQNLARDLCTEDPVQINVGSCSGELKAADTITQHVEVVQQYDKPLKFQRLINHIQSIGGKAIIFTQTKRGADDLCYKMKRDRYSVASIHGDKSQFDRDSALRDFKGGVTNYLVATDVAARGLHVDDIKHVINYDFPNNIEDYIHRIGRTGRAGNTGTSYTFFTQKDGRSAQQLAKVLRDAKQVVPTELESMRSYGGGGKGKGKGKGFFMMNSGFN